MNWFKNLFSSGSDQAKKTDNSQMALPPRPISSSTERMDGLSTASTDRDVILLSRRFASNYTVDGWNIDATAELHLSIASDMQIYGLCGPSGCVLRVWHDPPILSLKGIHIRGVTICPTCEHEQHFIAGINKYGAECYTDRCLNCDVLVDISITNPHSFLNSGAEFYLTSRRHVELNGSKSQGLWKVSSSRINRILVFDRETTKKEDDEQFQWLRNRT
jgi:hypothetical protein